MWYRMLGRILQGNTVGKVLSKLKGPLKTCAVPPADLPRFLDFHDNGLHDRSPQEVNVTSALGGVQQWRVQEIYHWIETYGESRFAGLELNKTLLERYAGESRGVGDGRETGNS